MDRRREGCGQLIIDWPTQRPHFAIITKVTDGDTIRADIDLDLKLSYTDYPVRFTGCNAAEKKTEAGKAALAHLQTILRPGDRVILLTIKDYKFGGEFVARLFFENGEELVPRLIREQWLAYWDGRGIPPLPPWPRTVTP